MTIMIEVEDELQPFATAVKQALVRLRTARAKAVTTTRLDYAEIEEEMAAAAASVERSTHDVLLQVLDIDAAEVLVDGERYRRVLRTPGRYYTMAGEASAMRTLAVVASEPVFRKMDI